MLHTNIVTSIPAVADAYEKFTAARKEQADLSVIAARRHAEWVQEVASLPVGTVMPTEPSSVPTDAETSRARAKVHVTTEALKEAINANFDALSEAFREQERIALAEISELDTRISEVTANIEDLIRDVIWVERASERHFALPQSLCTDMKDLVVDVARGGSVGRNHPAGTFFQNI